MPRRLPVRAVALALCLAAVPQAAQGPLARDLAPLLQAVIDAPSQAGPRAALAVWAQAHGERLTAPPIQLPAQPAQGQEAGITITIDGNKAQDPLTPVYFAYSVNAAVWRQQRFRQRFPRETAYRDSLPEEREGIRALLATVRQQRIPTPQLDPTLRTLQALERDGMVDCWILLDESTPGRPSPGLSRDYPTYRASHARLLRAYLVKYDLRSIGSD